MGRRGAGGGQTLFQRTALNVEKNHVRWFRTSNDNRCKLSMNSQNENRDLKTKRNKGAFCVLISLEHQMSCSYIKVHENGFKIKHKITGFSFTISVKCF